MTNIKKGVIYGKGGYAEIDFEEGSPVKDFIKEFLEDAEKGLKDMGYTPCSKDDAYITLDLNASVVKEGEAGLKIKIFNFGGKKSDTNAQRIIIYARKLDEITKAELNFKSLDMIAKAKMVKETGIPFEMVNK